MTYADATATVDSLDALGRRTGQTDEANISTSYTYAEAGNKLTDAEGRTTRWAYGAFGRPVSRTLPLGQQETYGLRRGGQSNEPHRL